MEPPKTDFDLKDQKPFETYKQMIEIGNGLSLNQVCNITHL